MIFDYLITIVSLKATEIGMSEVTKKMDDFTPPHFPSERQITQRDYGFVDFTTNSEFFQIIAKSKTRLFTRASNPH